MLRAELHAHTVYSYDGHITFEELARTLKRRRIDVIAITDHDTIAGALEFRKWCVRHRLNVHSIVGEEKTLQNGTHLIGLFLKEAIRSEKLFEAIDEIQQQGGVAVLPHPFRHRDGPLWGCDSARLLDNVCFEIFNPKCNYDENSTARGLIDAGLLAVGGSDAHYTSELGECVIEFQASGELEQSLRDALVAKAPLSVWGVTQLPGAKGRKYAPLYYKVKPYVRVPRPLVPVAQRIYSAYRNAKGLWGSPVLEMK